MPSPPTAPAAKVKKPRRWKAGTVALREIKRSQRSTDLMLPKSAFERVVREMIADMSSSGVRLQADALKALQTATEQYAAEVFTRATTFTVHAGRITLSEDDLKLAVAALVPVAAN